MMKFYYSPSCASCRKARNWLENNNVPYIERNIIRNPLKMNELKEILSMTEDGTSEITSTRSRAYEQYRGTFDDLSVSEFLEVVQEHPSLLRRPIMMDDKRLQVGFSEDEIRCFLPRKVRRVALKHAQMMSPI